MKRLVLGALAALLLALPAIAEPRFPPGSRIGIAPLPGMEPSRRFTGFEAPERGAAVTLVEMPPEAFAQVEAGLTPEALKGQGVAFQAREEIMTADGRAAVLIRGEQKIGGATLRKWLLLAKDPTLTAFVIAQAGAPTEGYADGDLRRTLASLTVRPPLTIEAQIEALPFRVGDLGGYRPVRVLAGNAVLLTEGPLDVVKDAAQPLLVVAAGTTPPPRPEARPELARGALFSNPAVKDLVVERSQSFRQRGSDWHEMVARGADRETGAPIVVIQTIRFAPEGFVRAVGIARAEARDTHLSRFRRVIDSLE